MKKITIAIDGYSSCGKSTIAKALAKALNYAFVDSGAMYRAVTLYFLENQVDIKDKEAVALALKHIDIRFRHDGTRNRTILNGRDVEEEIRKMQVSNHVSEVAAISAVRRAMVAQQQQMGKEKAIVMDGRDIGTVVFPNAELKIFLTAHPDIRAQRRYKELLLKDQNINLATIKENLTERDRIDTTRADSPLRQAEDAIVIDNSSMSPEEQLQKVIALAKEKLKTDKKKELN